MTFQPSYFMRTVRVATDGAEPAKYLVISYAPTTKDENDFISCSGFMTEESAQEEIREQVYCEEVDFVALAELSETDEGENVAIYTIVDTAPSEHDL